MLTDMIVEEEFERNDDELWCSRKDLEHDLHLAAELGKTLLDRNHELEQGLQQMYSTNQEQVQEIEYLNKQVELLRQMNDQHAKVYEQLDTAARELERSNHSLVLDNRAAQARIQSLTETIDQLQTHMESLQVQVEELKAVQSERCRRERAEMRRGLSAQSLSCLKELYDLQQDTHLSLEDRLWAGHAQEVGHLQEENSALLSTLRNLQAQLVSERTQREEAERATELTVRENQALEHRLVQLQSARRRQSELEAELEELRQLWRSETPGTKPTEALLPDNVFFPGDEKVESELGSGTNREKEEAEPERRRCNSESLARGVGDWADELRRGHERSCIRRALAVKQRGISLLNEVDAQYSALQLKYEELLRRCQHGADGRSHKAVQTPAGARRHSAGFVFATTSTSTSIAAPLNESAEVYQPEYKALFKEIFTCIQKTKEDLSANKATPAQIQ